MMHESNRENGALLVTYYVFLFGYRLIVNISFLVLVKEFFFLGQIFEIAVSAAFKVFNFKILFEESFHCDESRRTFL